jgi:hypothetical protein
MSQAELDGVICSGPRAAVSSPTPCWTNAHRRPALSTGARRWPNSHAATS